MTASSEVERRLDKYVAGTLFQVGFAIELGV